MASRVDFGPCNGLSLYLGESGDPESAPERLKLAQRAAAIDEGDPGIEEGPGLPRATI